MNPYNLNRSAGDSPFENPYNLNRSDGDFNSINPVKELSHSNQFNRKILVAEDETNLLLFYKIILEDKGYEVFTARNGQEAIDRYVAELGKAEVESESSPFDLVLLDHRMPKKTGIEAAKEINRLRPNQKMLMVTAFSNDVVGLDKPKELHLMQKPFETHELVATIDRLLGNDSIAY